MAAPLPTQPSFARIALNRTTFGARDTDVAEVEAIGWNAWVERQLVPPAGDDPDLAAFIARQTMHIEYPAYDVPPFFHPAANEDRPLNYLKASTAQLYAVARDGGRGVAFAESTRILQEISAAIYMRNTHSRFQLREFMTDFWLNHFSIGSQKGTGVSNTAVAYDRDVIRPNVFGNFRTLIEAVTKSASMMLYLDNADSTAALPNENYARELMELHTMGEGAYLGKTPRGPESSSQGFTDADIVQAARALSGWTVDRGQIPFGDAGAGFVYHAPFHNLNAGLCLGFDLSSLTGDMAQGQKVLDLVAYHPATPGFICRKICRRMFGDNPPDDAVERAKAAWIAHRDRPDQIGRVLRAILTGGPEVGTGPVVKLRRPYERQIALLRTTETVVGAESYTSLMLEDVNDSPFSWPTPNGRPDVNSYWLNTYTNIASWQYQRDIFQRAAFQSSLLAQTPAESRGAIDATVEYWVGRMIGYRLSPASMTALSAFVAAQFRLRSPSLDFEPNEEILRSLVSAISMAPEFVLR